MRQAGRPLPPPDVVEREVLEQIILERLQAAAAERSGVTVSDEEVDQAVASIAQRNGITVAQMKQILAQSGMSISGFRENIRKQLLEVAFQRQRIGGSIQVSDAEIDNYLAQHNIKATTGKVVSQTHARHILIRTGERTSDRDASEQLSTLRNRIINGEDFATLARANSDDTASALKGGDLGWLSPGDTVPEFENIMASLAPNTISEPFRTPFGWHIIQVIEKREQNIADQARRNEAATAIRQRKGEEALELLTHQLRDEAHVEIRLDKPEL
jgi:peptidyl-prolyl cis-trans isomerase SurA